MRYHLFILVISLITCFLACRPEEATTDNNKFLQHDDSLWIYTDSDSLYYFKPAIINGLEIPKAQPKENIISHTAYALSFNATHKQANWVAYELTSEETHTVVERTNKFLIDPKVMSGTANDKDYTGTGYDRGHLAPASDMAWSSTAMIQSFYYSNISPQKPGFNRGVWKRLEELVRIWAVENKSVYIVTGGVLTNDLAKIGNNKVSVPKHFYKVILDYNGPSIKGIGFILPNEKSSEPLQRFAVTIDSVEKFTGIDFFYMLPDEQENIIERTLKTKLWTWKSSKTTSNTKKQKSASTVQCSGTTKAGKRCKRMTKNSHGRCYQH